MVDPRSGVTDESCLQNPIQNQSAIFKPKAWLEVFILVSSTHPKQLWIHTILSVMSTIYEFSVHFKKKNLPGSFDSGLFHTSPQNI